MFETFLFRSVATLVVVALLATMSQAVNIDYVPVGNPGNVADDEVMTADSTTGYGSVADPYLIGTYEVTNGQYIEFLNGVATVDDPNGLYNTKMAGTYGGIDRTGSGTAGSPWVYSAKGADANCLDRPVNFVSFYDTLRFSNWLHNGQLSDPNTTEDGAYDMSLGSSVVRKPGARVFLPSEDEWYKAAYYDGDSSVYYDYPTGTDTEPSNVLSNPASDPGNNANFYDYYGTGNNGLTIGSPYYTTEVGDFENSASPYGTFDQGGNIMEWNETLIGPSRGVRGSYWNNYSHSLAASYRDDRSTPTNEDDNIGFRVASVPEPSTIILLLTGALGLLFYRIRRKNNPPRNSPTPYRCVMD